MSNRMKTFTQGTSLINYLGRDECFEILHVREVVNSALGTYYMADKLSVYYTRWTYKHNHAISVPEFNRSIHNNTVVLDPVECSVILKKVMGQPEWI